ncbi:MAPK kinase substrate protein At1g80180 [Rhodamnia argentea]|uniref:MAPK kinase substrate protein At1g80180 n=1 Tax=Rhodamnia argentea TaxID=178133 RepID=A0A8B8MZ16_9MYRT|nr:MAPK kinase substrate protein At1g80180 [Rhodamnia argentea]
MVALQRSVTSFRRQGSSGLVWDDDKLILSGVLNPIKPGGGAHDGGNKIDCAQLRQSQSAGTIGMMKRSSSAVEAPAQPRQNVVVPSSDVGPTPRKVSGCCFSGVFGRSAKSPSPKT